jgi:hypothetical protein
LSLNNGRFPGGIMPLLFWKGVAVRSSLASGGEAWKDAWGAARVAAASGNDIDRNNRATRFADFMMSLSR